VNTAAISPFLVAKSVLFCILIMILLIFQAKHDESKAREIVKKLKGNSSPSESAMEASSVGFTLQQKFT